MVKFLQGNCIDKIKELEDNSIDCVVSSPPYFGLRDYGTGTWKGGNPGCLHKRLTKISKSTQKHASMFKQGHVAGDAIMKDKCNYCGAVRVDEQFGLEPTYQEYIANTVRLFAEMRPKLKDTATIWWNVGDSYSNYKDSKSVGQSLAKGTSREKAHEIQKGKSNSRNAKLLKASGVKDKDLMMIPNRVAIALQDDGWYIRSEIIWHKPNPMPESVKDRPTSSHEKIWLITKNKKYYYDAEAIKEPCTSFDTIVRDRDTTKLNNTPGRTRMAGLKKNNYKLKNKRNVWIVTTKPFKGAHFATFPKDLIEPCILAGCPKGGVVLDPFGGAGTTGIVAKANHRQAILIELNPEYIQMAKNRIHNEFGGLDFG